MTNNEFKQGDTLTAYCYHGDKLIRKIRSNKLISVKYNKNHIMEVYYEDSLGLDDVYEVDCTEIVFENE